MSFFSFFPLFDVGVDAPKPSEVETSEQLPTSSSNSEKQPTAPTDESKPGADTKLFSIYSRGLQTQTLILQGGRVAEWSVHWTCNLVTTEFEFRSGTLKNLCSIVPGSDPQLHL